MEGRPATEPRRGCDGTPELAADGTGRRFGARPVLAALLLVTALAGWLFGSVLAGGRSFGERDLAAMDRPARAVLVRLWRSFPDVPQWNPYAASGQPFAANPHNAVFYPFTWLFLLLPFDIAFSLQIILPVLLSLAGMVLLLLTLGRSRAAALYGGLLWSFGGVLLSATNLLPVLFTVAPVPLVLAFFIRVLRRRRIVDWLLLVAAFALSCAGGEPVSLLAEGVLLACAWLAAGRHDETPPRPVPLRTRLFRHFVPLAALLAGAAVAAPVLIPAALLQARTARSAGLPLERATVWSFPPPRLAELALPRAWGDTSASDASRYWGSPLYPSRKYPLVYSIYAGVLTPLLALLGLGVARRGWVWAGAAIGGLGLAFGRHAPLFALAYAACPPLRTLRYPEKWLVVPAFAVAVLAAGGFDALVEGGARRRRAAAGYLGTSAAMATVLAAMVAILTHAHGSAWWAGRLVAASGTEAFAAVFPATTLVQVAVALAGMASLWILNRHGRTAGLVALLLLAAIDLGRNGRYLLTSEDPAVLDTPPSLYAGLVARPSPPRLFNLAQRQDIDERLKVELAPPPTTAGWGIPTAFDVDFDLTQLRWSDRAATLVTAAAERDPRLLDPLLARRGVGLVLRVRAEPPRASNERAPRLPRREVLLHTVPAPRPETSCVEQIVRVETDADWLVAVQRLGRANRDAALLEPGAAAGLPDSPSACDVTTVSSAPDRLSLRITAHGPGRSLLAVNRTWDESWSSSVDGAAAGILRADVDLMAVPIAPGTHTVTLTYDDRALARSLHLSLAALGLCAVIGVAATIRRRTSLSRSERWRAGRRRPLQRPAPPSLG